VNGVNHPLGNLMYCSGRSMSSRIPGSRTGRLSNGSGKERRARFRIHPQRSAPAGEARHEHWMSSPFSVCRKDHFIVLTGFDRDYRVCPSFDRRQIPERYKKRSVSTNAAPAWIEVNCPSLYRGLKTISTLSRPRKRTYSSLHGIRRQ
jgi:hypothetical protein